MSDNLGIVEVPLKRLVYGGSLGQAVLVKIGEDWRRVKTGEHFDIAPEYLDDVPVQVRNACVITDVKVQTIGIDE